MGSRTHTAVLLRIHSKAAEELVGVGVELAAIGNQWRFFNDVQDTWESVKGILDQLGAGQ